MAKKRRKLELVSDTTRLAGKPIDALRAKLDPPIGRTETITLCVTDCTTVVHVDTLTGKKANPIKSSNKIRRATKGLDPKRAWHVYVKGPGADEVSTACKLKPGAELVPYIDAKKYEAALKKANEAVDIREIKKKRVAGLSAELRQVPEELAKIRALIEHLIKRVREEFGLSQ